jgi:hypothetical protein
VIGDNRLMSSRGYGWLMVAGIFGVLRAVRWAPLFILALVGGRAPPALMMIGVTAIVLGASADFLLARQRWAWWVSIGAAAAWLVLGRLPLVTDTLGMDVTAGTITAIVHLACIVLARNALLPRA